MDRLSDLRADWEDATVAIPSARCSRSGGPRQKDLVGVFPTESVVSEVLAGRRELTRKHIAALARFFKVSPAAFFPAGSGAS